MPADTTGRERAEQLDRADPLAAFRERYVISDPETVYLDGNSLGRLPVATRTRLHEVVEEWATDLVAGWERWMEVGAQVAEVLAGVVGAGPDELTLADSTSVNLYKLARAACAARPGRTVILTDDDNFPTDRYILEGIAAGQGLTRRLLRTGLDTGVGTADVAAALDGDVALVCLSHVAYRSGAVADLPGVTRLAHDAGALVLWDLSHSAGAVPVGLDEAGADLAVGCTYKHLNGGPGAPAYLYVRRDLQDRLRQPIWGWFGQTDQFAMGPRYEPLPDIRRFQVGTPPVLSAYAALEGIRLTAEAGTARIAAKVGALGGYAVELVDAWLAPLGFHLASPRQAERRGAHVTVQHPQAWQICQALRAARVIADFRAPQRMRLGLAPLYTRFVDVHTGLSRLRDLVLAGSHESYSAEPAAIT
ncbi:MAG TPA: kynureninase [Rugosimonospora sp.]|nr:kynureninase [Rugosimonospora sp.]